MATSPLITKARPTVFCAVASAVPGDGLEDGVVPGAGLEDMAATDTGGDAEGVSGVAKDKDKAGLRLRITMIAAILFMSEYLLES